MSSKYNVRKQLNSFNHAVNGLWYFMMKEPKAIVHTAVIILILIGGIYFPISNIEWAILIMAILFLLGSELLNTSIEELCDLVEPNYSPSIKIIKDLAAGGVLAFSIGALSAAIFIFYPYLVDLIHNQ